METIAQTEELSQLNVPVPSLLMRRLKIAAAIEGKTLKDYMAGFLTEHLPEFTEPSTTA